MINVALAGDFALNLHALASLFHPLPGIRVVSISRSPATLICTLTANTFASASAAAFPSDPASTPAPCSVSSADFYPHVLLLDVNFELRPATQVINFVRKSHPAIHLIVLGLTRDEEAVARLFRAGADRYLPKNAEPLLLEQTIREVVAAPAPNQQRPTNPEPDYNPTLSAWPTVTDAEYRFFKLAISDVPNEDIRKKLRICESSYTRLVQQTYDRFNVRSRDGLAVALFKLRWLVRDDL